MTQVNIKMLKDSNNDVFLPFSTTDAVFEADSNKTLKDILTEQAAEIEDVAGDIPTNVSDLTNDSGFITGINSTDVTTALGFTPMDSALKGANSGVAELDATGKVPSSQLPSYVDDVIEVNDYASLPSTGEAGKIYITKDTNKTYRWSGSAYVEISESLALGETSSTAYRGDRGKTAYDHSQAAHAPSNAEKNTIETISLNGTALTPDANRNIALTNIATTSDIPTVNNATLTIKKNSSSVGTFTANASSNVDIDITVPTKTSDLTNDSNFITNSDLSYKDYSTSKQYVTMDNGVYRVTANNLTISYYDACTDQYDNQEYHQDITLSKGDIITISRRGSSSQDWGTSQVVGDVIKITGSINRKYVLTSIISPSSTFGSGWSDYNFDIKEIEVSKTSDLVNDSGFITNSSLPDMSNYLAKNNTTAFTPTGDYQPATKKYVDDNAGGGSSDAKDITCVLGEPTNWSTQTWSGITTLFGEDIWTDGEYTYYSHGSIQKIFNPDTLTWDNKTWTGLTDFTGDNIFTDGTDIYYAGGLDDSMYYSLNKETSRWTYVSQWENLNIYGGQVWTDGTNTYLSSPEVGNYIFNKNTKEWEQKIWNGDWTITGSLDGNRIWNDGTNIYFSDGSIQAILNTATDTWVSKTWNGYTNIDGLYVWTDGTNYYYSYNSTQYVLDKTTSTWKTKTWSGLTSFLGYKIWHMGENTYHSYANADTQYKLDIPTMSVQDALDFILQNMSYAKTLYTNPSDTSDKNIWIATDSQ